MTIHYGWLSFRDLSRSRSQTEPLTAMQSGIFALPVSTTLNHVQIAVKDAHSHLHLSNVHGKEAPFESDNMPYVQCKGEV